MDSEPTPSPSPTSPETKTCRLFCDSDAEVTFMSNDGILFKIYSKYLATASTGFAIPESTTVTIEPVVLEESAQTLEVLFQFINPRSEVNQYRQPSVIDMEVNLFFSVAEAAEKYLVYGAMNTCITRMYLSLYTSNPIQVLNHAAKHGYTSLADLAAPMTVSLPISVVADGLTFAGLLPKWVKYFDHWLQIAKFGEDLLRTSTYAKCKRLSDLFCTFLRTTTLNPRSTQIGKVLSKDIQCQYGSGCQCTKIQELQLLITKKVEAIPKFSNIV